MQDRRRPAGASDAVCGVAFKWLGLVRLPRSSKVPACQQRFELTFAWTRWLFICSLSLAWTGAKQPSGRFCRILKSALSKI